MCLSMMLMKIKGVSGDSKLPKGRRHKAIGGDVLIADRRWGHRRYSGRPLAADGSGRLMASLQFLASHGEQRPGHPEEHQQAEGTGVREPGPESESDRNFLIDLEAHQ